MTAPGKRYIAAVVLAVFLSLGYGFWQLYRLQQRAAHPLGFLLQSHPEATQVYGGEYFDSLLLQQDGMSVWYRQTSPSRQSTFRPSGAIYAAIYVFEGRRLVETIPTDLLEPEGEPRIVAGGPGVFYLTSSRIGNFTTRVFEVRRLTPGEDVQLIFSTEYEALRNQDGKSIMTHLILWQDRMAMPVVLAIEDTATLRNGQQEAQVFNCRVVATWDSSTAGFKKLDDGNPVRASPPEIRWSR